MIVRIKLLWLRNFRYFLYIRTPQLNQTRMVFIVGIVSKETGAASVRN